MWSLYVNTYYANSEDMLEMVPPSRLVDAAYGFFFPPNLSMAVVTIDPK